MLSTTHCGTHNLSCCKISHLASFTIVVSTLGRSVSRPGLQACCPWYVRCDRKLSLLLVGCRCPLSSCSVVSDTFTSCLYCSTEVASGVFRPVAPFSSLAAVPSNAILVSGDKLEEVASGKEMQHRCRVVSLSLVCFHVRPLVW
jgi:hypothetical protein